MPSPADILSTFHLRVGVLVGKWKICGVSCSSIVLKQSSEYQFPLTLNLSSKMAPQSAAIAAVAVYLLEPLVVYSSCGNPYLTQFHPPRLERVVESQSGEILVDISLLGHSLRAKEEPDFNGVSPPIILERSRQDALLLGNKKASDVSPLR